MMLIDLLKEQYNWTEGRLIHKDLIETDKGLKRIRYWSDKQLLDWHITWRDHCSDTPYLLMDRMLRTKEQQPFVHFEGAYVTVHDEVVESFVIKGQESAVAEALASFVHCGSNVKVNTELLQDSTKLENEPFPFEHSDLEEEEQEVYRFFIEEGEIREKKAAALLEMTKSTRLPILVPIQSVEQMKTTANVLYWVPTTDKPVKGYAGFDRFFRETFLQAGEDSCKKLIEHLVDRLDRDQAIQFLAEFVKPNEWNDLKKNVTLDHRRLTDSLQQMSEQWELSKHLVQLISMTIDKKKVSVT